MKKPLQGLQKQGGDKAAQAKAEVKKALPDGVPTPGAPKTSSRPTPKPFTASKSPVAPAPAATAEQAAKAVAAPVQQVCCSRAQHLAHRADQHARPGSVFESALYVGRTHEQDASRPQPRGTGLKGGG